MRRPVNVSIWTTQDRRDRNVPKPWSVRWVVNGRVFTKSFAAKAAAEDLRSRLLVAQRDGHRFDPATGWPSAWAGSDDTLAEFAVLWVDRQKPTWAPRSLKSAVEGLARGLVLGVPSRAPAPPAAIRQHLTALLTGDVESQDAQCAAWLRRWSLPLADFDAEAAAAIHAGLGIKDDGTTLSAETAGRYRKTFRAMLNDAVALKKLPETHWPSHRRKLRRLERVDRAIDVTTLPDLATGRRILDAIASHQPGSHGIQLLSRVCYFIGTRPSEALALRVDDFDLPEQGWGSVKVERALDGVGGEGETKTGVVRTVPLPPELVGHLREWVGDRASGRLVETRNGNPPTLSNWNRALKRACDTVGHLPALSPYDLRHCAATMMIAAGASFGLVAQRLGNSVEVLTSVYLHAMAGDDDTTNARIEAMLSRPG